MVLITLQQKDECKSSDKMAGDKKLIYYTTHISQAHSRIRGYIMDIRLHMVALCYDTASLPNSNVNLVHQQPSMNVAIHSTRFARFKNGQI